MSVATALCVPDALAELDSLDRPALVQRWTTAFGSAVPRNAQVALLRRCLAWHVQMQASSEWRGTAPYARLLRSLRPPSSAPSLRPGTRLLREWQSRTHEVTVLDQGFEYLGKPYRSLSAISREITGTPWSGPLFFGLRS